MSAPRERLEAVDLLRGAVMVVMALDHVRDFVTSARFDPVDLDKTNAPLFFTRWITHFCAPVFVFLAGTGSHLAAARGDSKKDLARFLLLRGLWLVVLELTVVRFGWCFDVTNPSALLQVIWAIGWSMIVLAGLVFLPLRATAVIGVAMIASHDLLDGVHAPDGAWWAIPWRILHDPGPIELGPFFVWVGYPLVPWIGVMAVGYAFGALLRGEREARRRRVAWLGLGLTVGFVVLRLANVYGDPEPWAPQARGAAFTVMSFLDCNKYPPSLLYLLMTLGPSLLALAVLDREGIGEGSARPLVVLGRVPMFFYLVHLVVIHATALVMGAVQAGRFEPRLLVGPFEGEYPEGYGWGLPVVYAVWIAIVVALYPACAWFAGVKKRRREAWLRFL
jgi:uncharacterized membrane protein